MTQAVKVGGYPVGLGATIRKDKWWIEPLWTGFGFMVFSLYTTWSLFQGDHYWYGGYLSPFYSPLLFIKEGVAGGAPVDHAWIGAWPDWWPSLLPPSPAFFILIFPLIFRLTCYYYRKFYYRAYFASPPGCAVNPVPQNDYKGETGIFIIQNLHRYAMYIAVFYIAVLSYDAFLSFFRDGEFGIGVGSVVLTLNAVFLGSYTFGCHSLRHMIGGKADCFSCPQGESHGYKLWSKASWLNSRHMIFAWISMIWVGFSDVYVRLVSMGVFHDFSTWK